MNNVHVQHLENIVRRLEADPVMRKGKLLTVCLSDPTIDWDGIFNAAGMRGRHRAKRRWKQAYVANVLVVRRFPRGGSRRGARPPECAALDTERPLNTAPWYRDIRELSAFSTDDVWNHFRIRYPVLALYRKGWVADNHIAREAPCSLVAWEAFWEDRETASARDIGEVLGWPAVLLDEAHDIVVPIAVQLWKDCPWDTAWLAENGQAVHRAAVTFLRRTACLLYGFQLGGCSARGVWGAMRLPTRC